MDEKFEKEKREHLLNLALQEEMLQDKNMLKYSDDKIEPHIFSEEHNRRMKQIFKMADKVENREKRRRRTYHIAAAVAVFICFSTVTVTQVEAFRLPILRFFMEVKEKSTNFSLKEENLLQLSDEYFRYEPEYTPEGYVVTFVEETESGFSIQYKCEERQNWYHYLYTKKMENSNIDTENGTMSQDEINGKPAIIVEKGQEIRIVVDSGMQRFSLSGDIPYEEAIKIMESINY